MSKKQTQNKFRDIIGDYYKTNRKITEDYRENKEEKRPSNSREKSMIIVLIILIIILIIKSAFLDEVKNLTPEEQQFKDFVEYSVEQQYNGFLEKNKIMVYRIYDIYMADPDDKAVLRYQDETTGKMIEEIQEGRYNARVRGYLLWILPVKHFSVTAQVQE